MYQFPVDYAQKNIWCTPRQDTQSIIAPTRVSQPGGVWTNFNWQWERMPLPTTDTTRYHVYMFNKIRPADLGLPDNDGTWVQLSTQMRPRNLIVDIYSNRGIQMPRFGVWYRLSKNQTLLFAVQIQGRININLETEQLYFRFYRNAYYNSQASDPVADYIETQGQVIIGSNDLLTLQNSYQNALTQIANGQRPGGAVYAFVNGYRVNTISPFNVSIGDVVEWIYDSSIFKVMEIPVLNLPTFTSTLDTKFKYLLRDLDDTITQIAYFDDNDMWLYVPPASTAPQFWKGAYYHRNQLDAVRMVTHKDYAIPVDYVDQYVTQNTELGWTDPNRLMIRIHLRKSGWNRTLVDEANRISALYRLPDDQITQAMVGTNALVPNWQAATLEASTYPAVMGAKLADITMPLVQQALGYNAMSKILADTPQPLVLTNGQLTCQLPYGLTEFSTGYEFDSNGLLVGAGQHRGGTTYVASNDGVAIAEIIYGIGNVLLGDQEGQQIVTLTEGVDYRVYTCPIDPVTNQPTFQWTDITGSGQYAVIGTTLTMLTDETKVYPLVRTLSTHLFYETSIPLHAGTLEFTLSHNTLRKGNIVSISMEIPMETLDIWINDHRLVKDIDYKVNFPKVTVISRAFFVNPQTDNQKVSVRATGLYDPTATLKPVDDTGFVMWGRLSNNHRFDVRDDKVQLVHVGGRTFRKSDLKYAEDDAGVLVPDGLNGSPYRIADITVPMPLLVGTTTYAYRQPALQTDQVVSNYLTSKIAEADPSGPSVIPGYWPLYSPFFSTILADLMSGVLQPSYLQGPVRYTDEQVLATCKPYESWLAVDPMNVVNQVDPDNAYVEPHPYNTTLTISFYLFQFLQRVNTLYFQGQLNLQNYLNLAPLTPG